MRRRDFIPITTIVAAFCLVGCGPNGGSDTGAEDAATDSGGASPNLVEVDCSSVSETTDVEVGPGLKYVPSDVTIEVGETVEWTWASGVSSPHDVVADDDADCAEAKQDWFGSSRSSNPGKTFCVRFDDPGTWNYQCTVTGHCSGGMKGTVTVEDN